MTRLERAESRVIGVVSIVGVLTAFALMLSVYWDLPSSFVLMFWALQSAFILGCLYITLGCVLDNEQHAATTAEKSDDEMLRS